MSKITIAVTGGPSGGKTTLIETLQKDMTGLLSIVPEAASLLYRGGFPRKSSSNGRRHAQRAICFVQRELEDLAIEDSKTDVIVCDRGSLDSIAYWPDVEADFFKSLGTSRAQELARYQWVLHLDTADQDFFDTSNPVRTESHKEAVEINHRIKAAWQGHPQRIVISHSNEFLDKIAKAKKALRMMIDGKSFIEISQLLGD
ncbi:MAG: ATP-binding protein [Bdellovibrio sp.]|jgi:predicted ATPase